MNDPLHLHGHEQHRDPGDTWVELPDGRRFWGKYGAAGLLVVEPAQAILLQHRAGFSHFGGTWGIPGGARHAGEDAVTGALREAYEEATVPRDQLTIIGEDVLDLGPWTYTTVFARSPRFTPTIGDRESIELQWVPIAALDTYELHPMFAAALPRLLPQLG